MSAETATTSTETADIARRYFEAVGRGSVEEMMEFWEPGGYAYIHGVVTMRAPEGYYEWFGGLFKAFPDFELTVLDLAADEQQAAVRWGATGTFTGPTRFEGMIANGASIDTEGCDFLTIRDGLIREIRAYMNGAELARQLGALPPQGSLQERGMLGALNLRTRAAARLRR